MKSQHTVCKPVSYFKRDVTLFKKFDDEKPFVKINRVLNKSCNQGNVF